MPLGTLLTRSWVRKVANPSPWNPRITWCQSLFVVLGVSRNDVKVGGWLVLLGCESVNLSIACWKHRLVMALVGESSTSLFLWLKSSAYSSPLGKRGIGGGEWCVASPARKSHPLWHKWSMDWCRVCPRNQRASRGWPGWREFVAIKNLFQRARAGLLYRARAVRGSSLDP